jgi:enoyl-CoA hydratase/carnithine racemase
MKLKIKKQSPAYWKVTIDNPPLNLFDPEIAKELTELITQLEKDEAVKVVVFDSANPEYFMAHIDLVRSGELDLEPGPLGLAPWPDVARRFELAPFLTISPGIRHKICQ